MIKLNNNKCKNKMTKRNKTKKTTQKNQILVLTLQKKIMEKEKKVQ